MRYARFALTALALVASAAFADQTYKPTSYAGSGGGPRGSISYEGAEYELKTYVFVADSTAAGLATAHEEFTPLMRLADDVIQVTDEDSTFAWDDLSLVYTDDYTSFSSTVTRMTAVASTLPSSFTSTSPGFCLSDSM
jgi:hypothetical protein